VLLPCQVDSATVAVAICIAPRCMLVGFVHVVHDLPLYFDCHVGEKKAANYYSKPNDGKSCVDHDLLRLVGRLVASP